MKKDELIFRLKSLTAAWKAKIDDSDMGMSSFAIAMVIDAIVEDLNNLIKETEDGSE